jgi:hypothetical protein
MINRENLRKITVLGRIHEPIKSVIVKDRDNKALFYFLLSRGDCLMNVLSNSHTGGTEVNFDLIILLNTTYPISVLFYNTLWWPSCHSPINRGPVRREGGSHGAPPLPHHVPRETPCWGAPP